MKARLRARTRHHADHHRLAAQTPQTERDSDLQPVRVAVRGEVVRPVSAHASRSGVPRAPASASPRFSGSSGATVGVSGPEADLDNGAIFYVALGAPVSMSCIVREPEPAIDPDCRCGVPPSVATWSAAWLHPPVHGISRIASPDGQHMRTGRCPEIIGAGPRSWQGDGQRHERADWRENGWVSMTVHGRSDA